MYAMATPTIVISVVTEFGFKRAQGTYTNTHDLLCSQARM